MNYVMPNGIFFREEQRQTGENWWLKRPFLTWIFVLFQFRETVNKCERKIFSAQ